MHLEESHGTAVKSVSLKSYMQHDGDTRGERRDMSMRVSLKLEATGERGDARVYCEDTRVSSVAALIGEYMVGMIDGGDRCRRKAEYTLAVRSGLGDHLAFGARIQGGSTTSINPFDDPVPLRQP